ncbi:hypothetical protein EKO27_g11102 [Xylaria grammica]|uniref:RING-type domain-containing protein n=1 Tax=Xylaria grammica TaxID=363999 RepID=A0A439CPD4_9PEZI|nr:hypothetical protein EKO27_g11102 [Xylaria grammica]
MAEDNSITDNFALNWLPYFSPEGDVLPDILFAVECGICGNQLAISQPPDDEDIETFCVLPCGHAFGHQCINSWLGDSYNMREAISSCIVGGDGLPSECENCRSDGASSSHWDGNDDEGGFDDQFQPSFPLESEFSRMNLGGGPSNAYGMNPSPPRLDEVEEQLYGAGPDGNPQTPLDDFFESMFGVSPEPMPHDHRGELVNTLGQSVANIFHRLRSGSLRLPVTEDNQSGGDDAISYIYEEWQRRLPEIREKFSTDWPLWDGMQKISASVQGILQELHIREQELLDNNESLQKKDNRFDFLVSALEEFINGNNGLRYHNGLLASLLSTERDKLEDDARVAAEMEVLSTFLTHYAVQREQDPIDDWDFNAGIHEIINSTIYEILNLFSFDITPAQVPANAHIITRFELLWELCGETEKESRNLRLPETNPKFPGEKSINDALPYEYPSALHTRDIRLLKILPGTGEDQIKCRLEADEQEKGHQVRLMREIYSKAKTTTIWLGDSSQNQDRSFNAEGSFTPLPAGFGGHNIDGDDLVAIIEECSKYRMDGEWDEKQWAIYAMLHRCMDQIQLNEWWERIWTLQEAALPPKAPDLLFKGRRIPFDALIAAEDFILKFGHLGEHYNRQIAKSRSVMGEDVTRVVQSLAAAQPGIPGGVPLLMRIRRGLENDQRGPIIKTFTVILLFTDVYKATNPLDNIFALGSLLPEYSGKLIKVDYAEHYSDVFKRATARSFNSSMQLYLMSNFNFLFETALRKQKESQGASQEKSQEQPHVPSWVLDLTYSDTRLRGAHSVRKATDRVTVEAFVSRHWAPHIEGRADDDVCFATPTTLFCTGCYVDEISGCPEIPSIGDDDETRVLTRFLIHTVYELRGQPVPEDIWKSITTHGCEESKLLYSLTRFFSLQREDDMARGDYEELIKSRNREAAGKPAVVTATGLIGIGTAPVLEGDYLCWVCGAPVYLILRRVEDLDGVEKHRIIARVALFEAPPDMTKRIESLPMRRFQIV